MLLYPSIEGCKVDFIVSHLANLELSSFIFVHRIKKIPPRVGGVRRVISYGNGRSYEWGEVRPFRQIMLPFDFSHKSIVILTYPVIFSSVIITQNHEVFDICQFLRSFGLIIATIRRRSVPFNMMIHPIPKPTTVRTPAKIPKSIHEFIVQRVERPK